MKVLIVCAAVLGLTAVSAVAGEGQVSNQSLARLGLGQMKMMADSRGLEIRGLGVSDGSYGMQGDKDHHPKGDEHKHHEKHPECGHQHEKCCQSSCHSTCNVATLCSHVQGSCNKR
jgi:hypothetical protein